MMQTLGIAVVVAFSAFQSTAASAEPAGYRPEVGRPHPQVTLPHIDTRESVSLSDYRGKKVLLIHFASW